MKGWPLWKEVLKYHWCDVLLDYVYTREYSTLPVNDIWQDIAKRWTFGWGLTIGLSVNLFLFLFAFLRWFAGWWLLLPLAICLLFSFVISSACSCTYLYFRLRKYYRQKQAAESDPDGIGRIDIN